MRNRLKSIISNLKYSLYYRFSKKGRDISKMMDLQDKALLAWQEDEDSYNETLYGKESDDK